MAVPINRYVPYKPNLAKARELLKRAGYPHGFRFSIMASHYLPSDFTAALTESQAEAMQ